MIYRKIFKEPNNTITMDKGKLLSGTAIAAGLTILGAKAYNQKKKINNLNEDKASYSETFHMYEGIGFMNWIEADLTLTSEQLFIHRRKRTNKLTSGKELPSIKIQLKEIDEIFSTPSKKSFTIIYKGQKYEFKYRKSLFYATSIVNKWVELIIERKNRFNQKINKVKLEKSKKKFCKDCGSEEVGKFCSICGNKQ